MKIEGILQKNDYICVTLKYNWLEKIFGYEDGVIIYRQVGRAFESTHEPIYVDKEGNKLSPHSKIGEAINRFKRKQLYHDQTVELNMN